MRSILLLLTSLFMFIASALSAQWTQLPYLITGTDTATLAYQITATGGRLYYCTDRGLYASSDDGDSWTSLTYTKANTAGMLIRSVYADSATGRLYAGGDSALFVSADQGSTWSPTSLTTVLRINDIVRSGSRLLVAYGATGHGGVAYSTDGFATAPSFGTDTLPKDVFYHDGNNFFVTGSKGVYRTIDNGDTWTRAGTGYPVNCRFHSIVQVAGTYYTGDFFGNGLYISSDNGATWANRDSAVFHGFCQVFSATEAGGRILLSVDGSCNGNEPLKSSTDGITWPAYMSGLTPAYYTTVGHNASGSCFYTFHRNMMLPYRICIATGIDDIAAEGNLISPNPSHNAVTIHTGGLYASAIRMISMTGQVVYERQVTGMDQIQADISALAPGIYMVQVISDTHYRTTRFVKE